MAVSRFTSCGLCANIVILVVFLDIIVAERPSELSKLSSEREATAVFGSAGFDFLREQLQHRDGTIKELLVQRSKQRLSEGTAGTQEEQLSEGAAGTQEEQLAEGAAGTQEEQLAKQQQTIEDLKKLVEQWTTKNSAQVELTLQEVSELKTSLLDTREKLNKSTSELETTQEALRATQHSLQATQEALNVTKHDLKMTQKDLRAAMQETNHEMVALKKRRQNESPRKVAETHFRKAAGSTFVRWGQSKCPRNFSDEVYSGVVGGSWYGHSGGSPTHLCLTLTPEPDPRGTAVPGSLAYLYGAEYDGFPAFAPHDMPCALCRTKGATSTIMVPGALTCPEGWTQQYTGLLASGYHAHSRGSDTICLDGEPELRIGGHVDHDGDVFYLVVTQCGSLPCPPYVQAKLVTCVVCTL